LKRIYVNLKRFDIPRELGGVNTLAPVREWGRRIVEDVRDGVNAYDSSDVKFTVFFPEAHLIPALDAMDSSDSLKAGCQSVFRDDVETGRNFGAFTSNRTAKSMAALGVKEVIIGHCEERNDKKGMLLEAGVTDPAAVNRILNSEVKAAVNSGLSVLYCIGETKEEKEDWKKVLKEQIDIGLMGVDRKDVVIAYEPVWAIGPGKTPPGRDYIQMVAGYIKEVSGGLPVVYGGGLKAENARMLSSIPEVDGGLIALTRFSGDIGFYPEEYLEIVRIYMEGENN